MSQQDGLKMVMMRNMFYRDSYRNALLILAMMILVNVLLAFCVFYKAATPPSPMYFATTADGRLLNIKPLSDPAVSDSFVVQWTANKVRAAFNQDYIHWRSQLQEVQDAFTPGGWKHFLGSMQSSNNLKTLVDLKMVSNAEITGAPQILEKAIISGHFAWKIKIPVLVTFASEKKTIPMPMNVTVIVLRMPVTEFPQMIAINNFLPEVLKTEAGL